MKGVLIFLLCAALAPHPQTTDQPSRDTLPARQLQAITVSAQALLRDQGMQKTVLDSVALRSDVTGSLAQVLGQNSTLFIKSYGRATLSTASVRGTSPSHTQVTWNGIPINSPMLGMVDFSTIPAFFIDRVQVYHGPGATSVSSGSLGGAVTLATAQPLENGFSLQYNQGVGSFLTFDSFLRLAYTAPRWSTSTRVYGASSKNEYSYTNYRKKDFSYDEEGNVTGFTYPVEKNKHGHFRDLHILQEFQIKGTHGGLWDVRAWYARTDRGIPFLNVDYKDNQTVKNNQTEDTFRSVVQWRKLQENSKWEASAGYVYSDMLYEYMRRLGDDSWANMVHSQSNTHSFFLRTETEYHVGKWMLSGNVSLNQHLVKSMDLAVISVEGEEAVLGYQQARAEASAFVAARYRPVERLGLSLTLREDVYGKKATPPIPSFFAEFLISRKGNVLVKMSATRNYRYPTLNDLYFMPGGNPLLEPEHGLSFDGGLSFSHSGSHVSWKGSAGGFYSRISNWIVWMPTHKGFWSPQNVWLVESYGAEATGSLDVRWNSQWKTQAEGNFAWTRSLSEGKQLPYIPQFSGALTARLLWKDWTLTYDWTYYSKRLTTLDGWQNPLLHELGPYFMNDVALEKKMVLPHVILHIKAIVRNVFNEEYESVLARPMPGINYTLSLGIVPLFY